MGLESLNEMLHYCLANGVEDLILQSGSPWSVIWSSRVVYRGSRKLTTEELESLVNLMTSNPNASLDLIRAEPCDFNYSLNIGRGVHVRFRSSATGCLGLHGKSGLEIVMRPSTSQTPTMDDLEVPTYIRDNCMPSTGIVLICGPTGSGKTTLLDSILREHATAEQGRHILTFFSPIENDLNNIPDRTGIISQCEIGRQGYGAHLQSYSDAVRNFLRRHPHVVVFGEARDKETIEGAVFASMTGHSTYTTTHTSNVHMAIARMADVFSGSDRVRITNALIDNTRLIVHQRLLRRPNNIGRCAIQSALALTMDMRSELLATPIDLMPSLIHRFTKDHGISLIDDAQRQYERGLIHGNEMIALEAEMKADRLAS